VDRLSSGHDSQAAVRLHGDQKLVAGLELESPSDASRHYQPAPIPQMDLECLTGVGHATNRTTIADASHKAMALGGTPQD
jgi:hypothetical protein